MTEEQIEAAAYEIYREFIRYGVGTCMVLTVNGKQIPETPEQACARRWRRLTDKVRDQFIAEAKAATSTEDWI